MKEYLAHISEDKLRMQTVRQHLDGTADFAEQFAAVFDCGAAGKFEGKLHDIGKYSDAFQQHLLEDAPRCDHSTAGAKEAFSAKNLAAAFSIAGHHGGLPDGGNRNDAADDPTLWGRMKKELCDYSAFQTENALPPLPTAPTWLSDGVRETANFRMAFYIRMLYSCLVDADFLDTERFMSGGKVDRGVPFTFDDLLGRFDNYLHENHWDAPQRELDRIRWDILSQCRKAGAQKSGLFTLTVPTGGGKTGASLAFALQHAKEQKMQRIIYVIPYTSIIEQNAAVFRGMLGDENVLEHHSNVEFTRDDDSADPRTERKRLACENWDAPLVVTTAVQFFESLFAAKPSRCRKLHNMARSVIILDEAQMLPVPYLRPCIAALAELTQHYGCSVVLCTATQPSLNEFFKEYAPTQKIRELCPNVAELLPKFRRVTFCRDGELDDDGLAEKLSREGQALCIVNSRTQAQQLFDKLPAEGRFHLSTLMMPEHRRRKLALIRQRLKAGLPCRVISTSLIEAGVDVDFPTVYRATAGLDSILQAAGRCNREGRRDATDSVVHIFSPESGAAPLFRPNIAAAETALRQTAQPDDPQAIETYFSVLYKRKGSELDHKNIMQQWEQGFQGTQFPFRVVADEFHLIEQAAVTVYIPTKESEPLLAQLRRGEVSRNLFRKLGQYAVALYPKAMQALDDCGYLEKTDYNAYILRDPSLYSEDTGLCVKAVSGEAQII